MSVEGKQSEICLIDTFLQSWVYVSITTSVPVEMMFSLKSGSICECITCIKGLPWPCNDPCSRFRYNPPVSPPDCLVTSTVSGCLRVPVVLPTGIAAKITREQTYKMPVRSLGQEDPLEEGVATHSSLLAWRIPWTGEPGDPWSLGSLRVKHDSSD